MSNPASDVSPSAGAGERRAMPGRGGFATTRWSVVLHAGRADRTTAARDALARLCATYWFPLYAHVRRRGFAARDAEDLTQEFFARVLARQTLAQADPERGRFRAFIVTALNHFLADEWNRSRAAKRGGGAERLSLDLSDAEARFAQVADTAASPDQLFDREWALAVLRTVLAQLEAEYALAGRAEVFAILKPTLTGTREGQPYGELARQLGRNENAVKVAVHRLRQRYRALLQAEVGETVATAEEAKAELRTLLQALGA